MEVIGILLICNGTLMAASLPFIHHDLARQRRHINENRALAYALEKNRQWYKDDKTITYEVNPMFNKLCRTY